MSKLTRQTMQLFASNAGANQLEVFGSLAEGGADYLNPGSAAIPEIQSLSNYLEGLFGAVIGSNYPSIQDLNALFYLFAYELCYMFEMGIPEWDAATTYYTNSFVQVSGVLYQSLQDNNLNEPPASSPSYWGSALQASATVFKQNGTFVAPTGVTAVDVIVDFPAQGGDLGDAMSENFSSFCANLVDPDGNLYTWGQNGFGQLGVGDTTSRSTPTLVNGIAPSKWRQVVLGNGGGIGIDTFGTCYTWGGPSDGGGGQGSDSMSTSAPGQVLGNTPFYKLIEAPGQQGTGAGALDGNFNLWTWGFNGNGVLGVGDTINRSSPTLVLGNIQFQRAMYTVSGQGIMALDFSGNLWGWGIGSSYQLGNGTNANQSSPVKVIGNHVFKSFQVFDQAPSAITWGLDTAGQLWAWGTDSYGFFGNNTINTSHSSPVAVAPGIVFKSLAVGTTNNIQTVFGGIDTSGNAWLWGYNGYGALGNNSVTNTSSAVQVVGGINFSYLYVNAYGHACFGIDVSGNLWSWGSNASGILGIGSDPTIVTGTSSPVMVVGGNKWTKVYGTWTSGGKPVIVGIDIAGRVWCWGDNTDGELGNGNTTPQSSPVLVVGPWHPMALNTPQKRFRIAVTPGQSYAITLGYPASFGGEVIGLLAKQVTVQYG